jgi:diguanylate cyclase (GGDEF)-like protein
LREAQLSEILSEFARTMVTDFPIQRILDHLVQRIVEVLPITAAGVTIIAPGVHPRYVAASDESALRFEQLQTEMGEGPCLLAFETGRAVVVADLRDEERFPNFAPPALASGLGAVFTFPLHNGGERLGALDLYRDKPGPLSTRSLAAAQTLADVAAAYLLNAQARDELRDASDRSRERSLHDALTGLPNRILLLEFIEHALLRSRRSGKIVAVLFADLDRFKLVNDKYGHRTGDKLLVTVADRLTAQLRPGDILGRLSGDEFVVACEDVDHESDVEAIAARLDAALEVPFELSGVRLAVTASIGIAFARRGNHVPELLLEEADTAMYQAKRKGGARHQIIDQREQSLNDQRSSLQGDLHGAVTRGELRADYQPIVSISDGRVSGVEALLRWAHPRRGLIAPSTLIPFAEHSGLIIEIGQWVLRQACLDRHRWENEGSTGGLEQSVNVSAHQLLSPGFAATVGIVLLETGTDPGLVTLEMTESVLIRDSERALVVLNDLKDLGVRLALDDFGTGYSSLMYLKRFPVDIVKIDQGFVADLGSDPASQVIVHAVVDMAHGLGKTVIAEGVETRDQLRAVESAGCDSCQGFYFARPMSADNLGSLMHQSVNGDNLHLPAVATKASA